MIWGKFATQTINDFLGNKMYESKSYFFNAKTRLEFSSNLADYCSLCTSKFMGQIHMQYSNNVYHILRNHFLLFLYKGTIGVPPQSQQVLPRPIMPYRCALQRWSRSVRNLCPHRYGLEPTIQR